MTTRSVRIPLPAWLVLNVAALSASLAHTFVDHSLGLYGESSSSMSLLQATNIGLTCLVVAWWILCLAAATEPARAGLSGAIALAGVWALLANGVAAMVAAPPPADAFPYQDVAHLLSAVLGAMAAVMSWRELKRSRTRWSWLWSGVAVVLMIVLFVVQGVLSAPNL